MRTKEPRGELSAPWGCEPALELRAGPPTSAYDETFPGFRGMQREFDRDADRDFQTLSSFAVVFFLWGIR